MVRYPNQNPSEPVKKPQAQPVSTGIDKVIKEKQVSESVIPKAGKVVQDGQVEELQERLHHLEEKLDSLQKVAVPEGSESIIRTVGFVRASLNLAQRYRFVLIAAALMGLLAWLCLVVLGYLNVSRVVLELKPKVFNVQGEKLISSGNELERIEKPPGIWEQLSALNIMGIKTGREGHAVRAEFISFGSQRTRERAEEWEADFVHRYSAYRAGHLNLVLNTLNTKQREVEAQLSGLLERLADFKSTEQYFLVNERTKAKLIALAQKNALPFEHDFIDIRSHLGGGVREKLLQKWSAADRSTMTMFSLKLTGVEFKKFLVGKDFVKTYDEGTRVIKKQAVQLINSQAQREGMDEISTSLIIKDFFLSCRLSALEALLNKRYVVSAHELSGRLADYLNLKGEYEALDLKRNSLTLLADQIRSALHQGFAQEVIVRLPVNVVKF